MRNIPWSLPYTPLRNLCIMLPLQHDVLKFAWMNYWSKHCTIIFDCIASKAVMYLMFIQANFGGRCTGKGNLRVRAFFHKTVRVCHVYCNFKIGFTCQITVIFGTLKDGSLLINTLASNICFSYRNMFQNGVDALSKIVDAFLSKSSKFHLVRIIR